MWQPTSGCSKTCLHLLMCWFYFQFSLTLRGIFLSSHQLLSVITLTLVLQHSTEKLSYVQIEHTQNIQQMLGWRDILNFSHYMKKKNINTHINHHLIIIRLNDDTKFDINKQYTGHRGKYTFDTSLKLNPNWHTFAKIFHNGGCSLSCHIYENEQTITQFFQTFLLT